MTRRREDGSTAPHGANGTPDAPTMPVHPDSTVRNRGRTVIGEAIMATIAAIAVRRTQGVQRLVPVTAAGTLLDRLSRPPKPSENRTGDVSVTLQGNEVSVGVRIVVEYGRSLQEVAGAVREAVIGDIETQTGFTVKAVDVEIADLALPPDTERPVEEGL